MYRVVLTGGPGAGKTAVLGVLERHGYWPGDDAARAIIRERKSVGLPPRPPPAAFAEQILQREIASYESRTRSPAFYERGVHEAAASLVGAGAMDSVEATRLIGEYHCLNSADWQRGTILKEGAWKPSGLDYILLLAFVALALSIRTKPVFP